MNIDPENTELPSGTAIVPAGDATPVGPAAETALSQGHEGGAPSSAVSLSMLLRRKWSIVLTFVVAACAAVPPIWFLVKPQYSSTARILVQPAAQRILYKTEDNSPVSMFDSYLNTQVSRIRGPTVLQRVLDEKNVQQTSWYRESPSSLFGAPPSPLERLTDSLDVKSIPKTQMIMVTMRTRIAKDAEVIVNAVADQYLKLLDLAVDREETQRYELLQQKQVELQNQIDALMEQKARLAKQVGTDAPSELRTRLTVYREDLTKEIDALRRQRFAFEWEFARLQASASQPSSQPAATEDDNTTLARRYARDGEWRRLNVELERARHELTLGKERYGESHYLFKELSAKVDHAAAMLKQREEQIDLAPSATTVEGEQPRRRDDPAEMTEAELRRAIARSTAQESELTKSLDDLNQRIVATSDAARQLANTDEQLSRHREQYDTVVARREQLAVEEKAPGRVQIDGLGTVASKPSQDRRFVLSVLVLAVAAGLGLAVGYVRDTLDASVRGIGDIAGLVRAPFLGQLPFTKNPLQPDDEVTEYMLRESMRMIRTSLIERLRDCGGSVVVIASPGPEAGKTTFATLLARSLGELGKKVLLVDADLRRRTLTGRFADSCEHGLNTLLAGRVKTASAVVRVGAFGFDLLPAGRDIAAEDPELLANGAMTESLRQWRQTYDFVVLDTPPLLSVADGRILATHADGAIMVLRAGHTRRPEVLEAFAGLGGCGGRLLGTVLIDAIRSASYYQRYAGYYASRQTRKPHKLPA